MPLHLDCGSIGRSGVARWTKKGKPDEMRRSPQNAGPLPAPLLLLLALVMLFITLSPTASAFGSTGEDKGAALAVWAMCEGENGKVTDDDGIIGNSRRGADRSPMDDRFENGIDGALPGRDGGSGMEHAHDGPLDTAPRSSERARGVGGTEAGDGGMVGEDGTAVDGNSSGILPWIIAAIVTVSIVLVVLALIPRRNKSR